MNTQKHTDTQDGEGEHTDTQDRGGDGKSGSLRVKTNECESKDSSHEKAFNIAGRDCIQMWSTSTKVYNHIQCMTSIE